MESRRPQRASKWQRVQLGTVFSAFGALWDNGNVAADRRMPCGKGVVRLAGVALASKGSPSQFYLDKRRIGGIYVARGVL